MTLAHKSFESLGGFAEHIIADAIKRHEFLQHGLLKAAKGIVDVAKDEIGEYQPAVGPFLEWELLADSTERDKEAKGFPLDAPLERTGQLRDSYQAEVQGLESIAGSTDPVAYWQEVGTAHIPPREVLGPAAIRREKQTKRIIGDAYAEALLLEAFT